VYSAIASIGYYPDDVQGIYINGCSRNVACNLIKRDGHNSVFSKLRGQQQRIKNLKIKNQKPEEVCVVFSRSLSSLSLSFSALVLFLRSRSLPLAKLALHLNHHVQNKKIFILR
jgi:hypothetical protein